MKEINRMAMEAQRALDRLSNGKTYTTAYVANRLQKSAYLNSRDALICHMRDVIAKRATEHKFTTQKDIGQLYDNLYGMSGGRSKFREVLGDLLPHKHAALNLAPQGAEAARIPCENKLEPLFGESKLSEELSGIFSLNKKAVFSTYSDNTIRKAEKFAKLQLESLGWMPLSVKAIRSNEHFVLCTASIDTSDYTQVNIPIPVQVTNGLPALPRHFVADDNLVTLNKENVFLFVKDANNHQKKSAVNKYAAQRDIRELRVDQVVVPAALEMYADLEDSLMVAASHFNKNQMAKATNIVAAELSGCGVQNPQIKIASSTPRGLVLTASVPTAMGRVDINVPVDMPNGTPIIPRAFVIGNKTCKLNSASIQSLISIANSNKNLNKISRETLEMGRLTYHQLLDTMIDGVSRGDYKQAESALSAIDSKFGGQQYTFALDKFSKLLKHSSADSDRDLMIKKALESGDLIWVTTSVEPYCPKLGLPASKVDFDGKGRPYPIRRNSQTNNLGETGAMISTSRVALS
jgi:hypothetical protein